ncbi:stage III sporulation protein AG [Bacillus sp. FJAT-45350]|uniref:stage III sporulation protein AG n=1 Tax=Bacillus sp. FJAT-45350 TaxID=2011014 RepID=UPI000BB77B53|nr:stage III sporulation protein AG [Bacillus sp. FJAT-45350]
MDSGEKNDRHWLKKLVSDKVDGKKKKLSLPYVVLILCLGVALMILGNFFKDDIAEQESQPVFRGEATSTEEDQPAFGQNNQSEPSTMNDYEIRYENQLKETLEQIIGVSDVSVMINLAETEKKVYERNSNVKKQQTEETDREGGQRKVDDLSRDEQLVIVRNGDKEEPILIKKEKPNIRGVLVVAKGVDNIQVKSMVVEAVSRALDVPAHRVSVMPKKTKEE